MLTISVYHTRWTNPIHVQSYVALARVMRQHRVGLGDLRLNSSGRIRFLVNPAFKQVRSSAFRPISRSNTVSDISLKPSLVKKS